MTNREKEILQIIKAEPLISQIELANRLNIKRSSVAVHLSNLTKKGMISGRGYIVNEGTYVCVLGGVIMDITGYPKSQLIQGDANMGNVRVSLGGVGRNIAENLTRLDHRTKLISVLGDDFQARLIMDHCRELGIDMSDSLYLKNRDSSVHMAVMDEKNDMYVGLSDIDIFEEMPVTFVQKKKDIILNARMTIIDTNMPKEVIEFVLILLRNRPSLLDTVSGATAGRIGGVMDKIHSLKINRLEAGILTGQKLTDKSDIRKASAQLIDHGVQNVYITLGEEGVHYRDRRDYGFIEAIPVNVVNTSGAGDAFCAGVAYGMLAEQGIEKCALLGLSCATLALEHHDTVNPLINKASLNHLLKQVAK